MSFLNDEKRIFISLNIDVTKGTPEQIKEVVETFKSDFYKISITNETSIMISTKKATFEYLENCQELKNLLNTLNKIGFKAHNAKNQLLKIAIYHDKYMERTKHKVDCFINQIGEICKIIGRKNKVFKFRYEETCHANLCKNTISNSLVIWDNKCAVFKFFRSTLKYSTILASIEFVKNIFDFFEEEKITFDELYEDKQSVLVKYCKYCIKHNKYLTEYAKSLNFTRFVNE